MKSDIFFFISSIGFFLVTVLLCVVLVYAILIAHKVLAISIILKKKAEELEGTMTDVSLIIKNKAEEIGEAITDAKDFVREGGVVHWITYLFGSRAKRTMSKRSRSEDKDTLKK